MSSNMMRDSLIRGTTGCHGKRPGHVSPGKDAFHRVPNLAFLPLLLLAISATAAPHQLIQGQPGVPENRIVVNMRAMGNVERAFSFNPSNRPPRAITAPMPRADFIARTQNLASLTNFAGRRTSSALSSTKSVTPKAAAAPQAPAVQSPPVATSFMGGDDDNTLIPPDVGGAVGPNHVMTVHNNNVWIRDRAGNILSVVSLNAFWLSLGAPSTFDPKVVYDPYNDRWIFSTAADSFADTSSILIGVTQTGDPTGNWNLYRVDADASNLAWADYPSVGFNKDWIVVTVNMFAIGLVDQFIHPYFGENIFVFSKTNLYARGDGRYTLLQDTSLKGFTMTPAITYDNNISTMYLVQVDDLINNYGG